MKRFYIFLITILLLLLAFIPTSYADNNGNSFVVKPVYPDNQVVPDNGYFYLTMDPGGTQTLTVNTINNSNNDIKLHIETADSYTSPEGGIVYITQNTSDQVGYTDKGYMLSGNIKIPADSVIIKAGENDTIDITIKAPLVQEGEVLGAVRFYTLSNEEVSSNGNSSSPGAMINVKSAQTIPIRILIKNPEKTTSPSLEIGNIEFDDIQKEFFIKIANNLTEINKIDSLTYNIVDQSGNPTFNRKFPSVEMAPKTLFKFNFSFFNNSTSPGIYTIEISYEDQGGLIKESRKLEINNAQIDKLPKATQGTASNAPSNTGVYISVELIICVGAALVVLLIILLLIKKRKKSIANIKNSSNREYRSRK